MAVASVSLVTLNGTLKDYNLTIYKMDITPKNLKERLKKRGMGATEFIRELNKLQAAVHPAKPPITRNLYYHTLKGHTPKKDNMYLMAAVLKTPPKRLFTVTFDETKYNANLETYSALSS
jgi:hypothetical protein